MWRRLKKTGLAVLAASLTTLAGAGSASATVLEVEGAAKNEAVTITASVKSENSIVLAKTDGSTATICTESHLHGATESPFTATKVTGALSSLTFGKCTKEAINVHKAGQLYVEYIPGTTNGTVVSENAEVTVPTSLGFTVTCKTNAGTDLGTLTGTKEGHASIDVNAVLNCGFLLPSATWKGTYTVTSPTGLGVAATPTFLEVNGETKDESLEITASLESGTSSLVKGEVETPNEVVEDFATTCTQSHVKAATASPFSGPEVSGPLSELSFSGCGTEQVTVDKRGALYIEWTSGTNGVVFSENAAVTVPSPFGVINCQTGEGTKVGTLTGKASGSATMDLNAVINCGFYLPSATLQGSFVVTSPSGLGVSGPPTALEIGGVTQTESISITASIEPGTSVSLRSTSGELAGTCTASHMQGATTSPFTGTKVTGFLSELSFSECTGSYPKVDNPGTLSIEWSSGTNGTVTSSGAEVTVSSPAGALNCKTGAGTHIGTLTGKREGYATLDIDAPLDCGPKASNERWEASYVVTSPEGLGVANAPNRATLEVEGAAKNEAVTITASVKSESSIVLAKTDGSTATICTESHLHGATESPFTATKVTGALSSLTFGKCELGAATVHKAGKLYVEYTSGTNGSVFSEEAEVTFPTSFGFTVNCKTATGTKLGTLTGTASGHATIDIDAVLNCGFLLPSATLKGEYVITSPTGLGVAV